MKVAVERFGDSLVGERHRILDTLTFDQLRCHRAGRDRAGAAEGLELDVRDDLVIYFQIHFHDIAAFSIADLADAVRVLDDADILRIQKMLHYFFAI